jgi:hypothetical protein
VEMLGIYDKKKLSGKGSSETIRGNLIKNSNWILILLESRDENSKWKFVKHLLRSETSPLKSSLSISLILPNK